MIQNGAKTIQKGTKTIQNGAVGVWYRPGKASASAIDSLLGGRGRCVACFPLILNGEEIGSGRRKQNQGLWQLRRGCDSVQLQRQRPWLQIRSRGREV